MLLVLGGLWLSITRNSIVEEVTAATRVCEQWLDVLVDEARSAQYSAANPAAASQRLLATVKAAGRIRANALAVLDATGTQIYASPKPTYKAGRSSPAWFAQLAEPAFPQHRIAAGSLTLVITPDASRASLDAWDNLFVMTAWCCALLVLLFIATRHALNRAFYPLDQLEAALQSTGQGRFDIRLPIYSTSELNRLAQAYNGMADRLNIAVNDNVRLASERELASQLQAHLEAERRSIAQELHDELAQGITAVRALAGAIVQRSSLPVQEHAQSIISVTDQIQEGIRRILQRLRPLDSTSLNEALQRYLALWRQRYPEVTLQLELDTEAIQVSDALAVLRIIQEGLTNVVRHAAATQVLLSLHHQDSSLELKLSDNGRGLGTGFEEGYGLTGMRERVAALEGELLISCPTEGGFCLRVRLPC